ncbi:hypothetical protein GJ496_006015 [Pomphorhynchus laevis]|nr:hypothetical protein GJ496_006015 [Pomphorhynchus laevis]
MNNKGDAIMNCQQLVKDGNSSCVDPDKNDEEIVCQPIGCNWNYSGNGVWMTKNGSYLKINKVSIQSLSQCEQKIVSSIALNQLNNYGSNFKKYYLDDSRTSASIVSGPFYALPALNVRMPINKESSEHDQLDELSDLFEKCKPDEYECSLKVDSLFMSKSNAKLYYHIKENSDSTSLFDLIVQCCQYIYEHGLDTEGIFRKTASKKKISELKESIIDSGKLIFTSENSVHEVAGILKDLLSICEIIPRDVQPAFLLSSDFFKQQRIQILRLLVFLLPPSNRTALHSCLHLLNAIHKNSMDRVSETGKSIVSGNKMNSINLAIIFAPTLLLPISKNKSKCAFSKSDLSQSSSVLALMIESCELLFQVSSRTHNEAIKVIYRTMPLRLDAILFDKLKTNGLCQPINRTSN